MKFKPTATYLWAPILLGAVLFGCDQSETSNGDAHSSGTHLSSNPVNEVCPIMGGSIISDGGNIEWNGKLVGFCCPECKPKWKKLSEAEKAEKLAGGNHAGSESGTDDHSHS